MTPSDIVLAFRSAVNDEEEEYLFSDLEVFGYLDDAQKEFCRITKLLVDATTFASISVTASTPVIDFSSRIIEVVRATITGRTSPLKIKTVRQMDRGDFLSSDDYGSSITGSNWTTVTGTPRILVTDWAYGKARLYPSPTANATLSINAVVLPAEINAASTSMDVTDSSHQRILIEWMKHLAYMKDDADAFDEKSASLAAANFVSRANVVARDIQRATKPAGTTGYGGL